MSIHLNNNLIYCNLQSFLDKNKSGGLHHICIEVDNIQNAMKEVKSKGIRCLSEEPRIGAHNKPVLFLHVSLNVLNHAS